MILPTPNASVLVLVLFELKRPVLSVCPLRFNEPLVRVVVFVAPVVKPLVNCHDSHEASKIMLLVSARPLLFMVFVPLVQPNVMVPVLDQVKLDAGSVRLPFMAIAPVDAENVMACVRPEMDKF